MKTFMILCLSIALGFGLCATAFAASEGNADKAKGGIDKVEAAGKRADQAANERRARMNEKAAEVAKDANEAKAAGEKKVKEKAAEAGKAKEEAEKEMKGRAEKAEKSVEKEKGKLEDKKDMEEHAKGKAHEAQISARQKQLAHEQDKHNSRVARLQRIKELAQQEGDTKTIERVDKLIASENERYMKKTTKFEGKASEAAGKTTEKK